MGVIYRLSAHKMVSAVEEEARISQEHRESDTRLSHPMCRCVYHDVVHVIVEELRTRFVYLL
jgi:hypothetical protein